MSNDYMPECLKPALTGQRFLDRHTHAHQKLEKFQVTTEQSLFEVLEKIGERGRSSPDAAEKYIKLVPTSQISSETITSYLSQQLGVTHRHTGVTIFLTQKALIEECITQIIKNGKHTDTLPEDFLLALNSIQFQLHFGETEHEIARIRQHIQDRSTPNLVLAAYYMGIELAEYNFQTAVLQSDTERLENVYQTLRSLVDLCQQNLLPSYTITRVKLLSLFCNCCIVLGKNREQIETACASMLNVFINRPKKIWAGLRDAGQSHVFDTRIRYLHYVQQTGEADLEFLSATHYSLHHLILSEDEDAEALQLSFDSVQEAIDAYETLIAHFTTHHENPYISRQLLLAKGPQLAITDQETLQTVQFLQQEAACLHNTNTPAETSGLPILTTLASIQGLLLYRDKTRNDIVEEVQKEKIRAAVLRVKKHTDLIQKNNILWLNHIAMLTHQTLGQRDVTDLPESSGARTLFHLAYTQVFGEESTKSTLRYLQGQTPPNDQRKPSDILKPKEKEQLTRMQILRETKILGESILPGIQAALQSTHPHERTQASDLLESTLETIRNNILQRTGHDLRVGYRKKNTHATQGFLGNFAQEDIQKIREETTYLINQHDIATPVHRRVQPDYPSPEHKRHARQIFNPHTFPSIDRRFIQFPEHFPEVEMCCIDLGKCHVLQTQDPDPLIIEHIQLMMQLFDKKRELETKLKRRNVFSTIEEKISETIYKREYETPQKGLLWRAFKAGHADALGGGVNLLREISPPNMVGRSTFLHSVPKQYLTSQGCSEEEVQFAQFFGELYEDIHPFIPQPKEDIIIPEHLVEKYAHLLNSHNAVKLFKQFKGTLCMFYQYHQVRTSNDHHLQGTHPVPPGEHVPIIAQLFCLYGCASSLHRMGLSHDEIHTMLSVLAERGLFSEKLVRFFAHFDGYEDHTQITRTYSANGLLQERFYYGEHIEHNLRKSLRILQHLKEIRTLKIEESIYYACLQSRPPNRQIERLVNSLRTLVYLSGASLVGYIQRHPESEGDVAETVIRGGGTPVGDQQHLFSDDPLTEQGRNDMIERCVEQKIGTVALLQIIHSEMKRCREQTNILLDFSSDTPAFPTQQLINRQTKGDLLRHYRKGTTARHTTEHTTEKTNIEQVLQLMEACRREILQILGATDEAYRIEEKIVNLCQQIALHAIQSKTDKKIAELFRILAFDGGTELMRMVSSQQLRPFDQQPTAIHTHTTIFLYLYLLITGEVYQEDISCGHTLRRREVGGRAVTGLPFSSYTPFYRVLEETLNDATGERYIILTPSEKIFLPGLEDKLYSIINTLPTQIAHGFLIQAEKSVSEIFGVQSIEYRYFRDVICRTYQQEAYSLFEREEV